MKITWQYAAHYIVPICVQVITAHLQPEELIEYSSAQNKIASRQGKSRWLYCKMFNKFNLIIFVISRL